MVKRFGKLCLMAFLAISCLCACRDGTGKDTENIISSEEPDSMVNTEAEEEEKTVLRWALWDGQAVSYWEDLADAYMEKHQDVQIELVDLGSGDYSDTLATEISVKNSKFDLLTIKDMPGYVTLVAKGALEPLNDRIESDGIDLSLYRGIAEQLKADGELYQMPFRNDLWVLYYNKDLFDAAGVPYPDNHMTLEEYDEMVRAVAQEDSDRGRIYGAHYHIWRSTVQLFGILDGEHSILDGNYDFTKPYYEMVKAQEKDGICRTYVDTNVSQLHYTAAFAAGNTATMNMGSWYIANLLTGLSNGEFDREKCGNWGIVRYPLPEGAQDGATIGTITGIGVSSESENKEEAWEFVKFATGEEGAEIVAAAGAIPAIASEKALDIITGLEGFPQDEESREALTASQIYLEAPYDSRMSEINTILDEYHKDIMDGSISIDAGIQKMNEEIK